MTHRRRTRLAVFHKDGRTENLSLTVEIQRFCSCNFGGPPVPHTAVAAAKRCLWTRCDNCGHISLHVTAADFNRPLRGCGMEGCLLSMYVSRNHLPFWMCSCGQCHNTLDLQGWCVRRDPDQPHPYDRIDYPYTDSAGNTP